jgi:ribosomal protein S18 acetylase RimI-like enzyme
MTVEVRRARGEDALGIARVHVQGWREAYSHLVPAESLAKLSVDQRMLRWSELIPAERPHIWVATDGDSVVGWASTSDGHSQDSPRDLELEGIYVLASHYGTGAGQQLLDAALGDAPAFLWVADDNPRARAFYARNGFHRDGTTKLGPLAGTEILEARLVR